MAKKNFIHVGETGKNFYLTTGFDLTGATELQVFFQKPDESTEIEKTKTSDGVTDNGAPTAGVVKWPQLTANIFDTAGIWKAVVWVTNANGIHKSAPDEFVVKNKFIR